MPQPLLSIGMIFKNEIRCLERCLKALAPLREAIPCELVMADTGADDGSRQIAANYADILFDFPWVNDFSAARNAVMDRASGAWYLTLDADEALDGDIHELVEFLQSDSTSKFGFCQVCQRNYVFADNTEVYNDFFALRMVRMDTGLRYTGVIHETFANKGFVAKRLPSVILHHDGYISTGGIMQSKTQRNMPLLEKALQSDTYHTGRIVQCIESARTAAERTKYVRRGLRVVQLGKSKSPEWDPVIYRYAVETFQGDDLDYGLELLAEGRQKHPDSIFLQIDGEGFALQGCYHQQRYEEAAAHGALWQEALQKLDRGELNTQELGLSILHCANAATRPLLECMIFDCNGYLGQWETAGQTLEKINLDYLDTPQWIALMRAVFNYSEHLDHLTPQLSRFWETASRYAGEQKDGWAERHEFLLKALNVQFTPVPGTVPGIQRFIAQMEHCEPGRSAQISTSWDTEEVQRLLDEVHNWDEVLYAMYPHVMELGLDFPDAFYEKGAEFMAELAVQIPKYHTAFTNVVLEYGQAADRWKDPVKLTWLLDVTIAALRMESWEDMEHCQRLCTQFRGLAEEYLHQIYNPARLNPRDIRGLPGMHRFSWYCLRAQELLETGDPAECVRMLKAGLEAAPIMKRMVQFLLDEVTRADQRSLIASAPPELLALAERVRGILELYSPEDPAVAELKNSMVYQQVAYLIEPPAPLLGYGGLVQ